MEYIRQATIKDVSRIAEILVFTKRMNYRRIFHNDKVSFGEIQVYPLVQDLLQYPEKLRKIWVYDDEFVKGMIHVDGERIQELYVDSFFENQGIGGKLLDVACQKGGRYLWVLEKNESAIRFYEKHYFRMTGERQLEEGTEEYIIKMKINISMHHG